MAVLHDVHLSIAALVILNGAVECHADLFEDDNRRAIVRRDQRKQASEPESAKSIFELSATDLGGVSPTPSRTTQNEAEFIVWPAKNITLQKAREAYHLRGRSFDQDTEFFSARVMIKVPIHELPRLRWGHWLAIKRKLHDRRIGEDAFMQELQIRRCRAS